MKIRKSVLKKLILEIIESQASDQAKQQGLTSAGFGRYKDKSGKVVAKSQGGQLVKVGGQQPAQQPTKTATPEPAKPSKSKPTAPASSAIKPDTTDWKIANIEMADGEGYSHKYDNEPRPKRMKAIDASKYVGKRSEDRPVDYGHCQQIFIDKYGKENGEKTYEKLFLDQGTNFGWSLAGKIQQEKRAMISALDLEQPRDLDDVAYYPLWRKWQAKEGIDQMAGQQKAPDKAEPSVSQKLKKMVPSKPVKAPEEKPKKQSEPKPIPTHADNAVKQRQQSFMDTPEFDTLTKQLAAGKITPERYKSVMTAMMNLKENFRIFKKVLKEKKLEKTSI